ncbi:MAG: CBM35 domain-containing protein [Thermoguttaceae bacterium]|jgi:hypothetical protein
MNQTIRQTFVAHIAALVLAPLAALYAVDAPCGIHSAPAGEEITAAAFGDIHDTSDGGQPMGKGGGFAATPSGDTWYTAWAGDDTMYVNVDDGLGFENPGGKGVMLRNCLCMLTGNPNESTDGFRGVNLNPGSRGATIPNRRTKGLHGYTSSLYEQDGVLYQIRHAWSPTPMLWPPVDSCIIKSPDGGRNWVDHLGRTNPVELPTGTNSMFPALPWSWFNFVQYGKGGAAPAIDRAGEYVYLTAAEYLARVPRKKLANLNKADFQYYKGSPLDGALDSSWSSLPTDAGKNFRLTTVVYNLALKRYVATGWEAYFAPGEGGHDTGKARFMIHTAEHLWGPWKTVMSYGIWGRAGWNMLMANKFTSNDGLKMWYVFCGEYKGDTWYYGFQYMPLYLSIGPVDIYEAENAKLTGVRIASGYPGCSGSGYIEDFSKPGDRAVFHLNNVHGSGWHIVRIRYTSPKVNRNEMSIYVNGRKAKRVKFSENGSDCSPGLNWTDRSDIFFLNNGVNTFEVRHDQGDSGAGLMIDYVAVSREPTYDEGINIAPEATATASSGEAVRAISGCARDEANEWSAAGAEGEWIRLDWGAPKTVGMVRLYDKRNRRDQVMSGTLSFSDGSTLPVGRLQNDGQAGTVIAFPPKTVTWMRLTIDKVRSGTVRTGLGQFEVYAVSRP